MLTLFILQNLYGIKNKEKTMKHSIIKKAICTLSAAVCLGTAYRIPVSAAKMHAQQAYPKWVAADPNRENLYGGTYSWTQGALFWKTSWKEEYHYKAWTKRPVFFYTNWTAHQNQILTMQHSVQEDIHIETVSSIEVDGKDILPVNTNISCKKTISKSECYAVSLKYDLSNYSNYGRPVAIVAFQKIKKYDAETYRNGSYKKTETAYGFDKASPVITLVYR